MIKPTDLNDADRREVNRKVAERIRAMTDSEFRSHMRDPSASKKLFAQIAKQLTTETKGNQQ